jgi:hypothetical protein
LNLYHGTNAVIGTISLDKCRNRTDFGKGFYLTEKIETSQVWAIRKAELSGGIPTIIQYEIDENVFDLYGRKFPDTPEPEWLTFICDNRRTNAIDTIKHEPRHDYNWVFGPIADDKAVDAVDEYLNAETSDTEAILRLRAFPATFQFSLHTQTAVTYIDDQKIAVYKLKNGRWVSVNSIRARSTYSQQGKAVQSFYQNML